MKLQKLTLYTFCQPHVLLWQQTCLCSQPCRNFWEQRSQINTDMEIYPWAPSQPTKNEENLVSPSSITNITGMKIYKTCPEMHAYCLPAAWAHGELLSHRHSHRTPQYHRPHCWLGRRPPPREPEACWWWQWFSTSSGHHCTLSLLHHLSENDIYHHITSMYISVNYLILIVTCNLAG